MDSGSTYQTLSDTYSAPRTSYSQLMVTAHKAESKNEEIWDKVRARATVDTDLAEEMGELGQQIAKFMMALTKAGQGNNPSSAPSTPGRDAMGGDTMLVALPIIQTLTMVEVALDRPPQPTAYLLGIEQGARELEVIARVTRRLAQGGRAQPIGGTQILSNALGLKGGATWQGNALPCICFKPVWGTEGMWLTPCQQKPPSQW